MKKLIGFLVALVVALLGLSVGTYVLVDQKVVRNHVVQAFHDQTGLDLSMKSASFQIIPWPSFHAGGVVVSRSDCSTPFVMAKSVHADISLLALLHREVSFQDFTIQQAQVEFHRTHDGVCSSWLPFKTDENSLTPVSRSSKNSLRTRWKVSFDALHLSNTQVVWHDEHDSPSEERNGSFMITSLDLQGMRSVSPWIDLRVQHGDTPFSFKGRMGPFHRIISASAQQKEPWLFSLGLTFGSDLNQDQIVMDGSMADPHRLEGIRLNLHGHWRNLSDIEALFPHIGLPAVQNVSGMVDLREREEDGSQPRHGFAEAFSSLSHRLYPVQMHVQLGNISFPQGALGVEAPLHLQDVKMDADAPLAPLSINGNAEWGRFVWLFQANLGTLEKSVAAWSDSQHSFVPLLMTLQGRDKTLALLSQKNDKNRVTQDGVHFEMQGDIGRDASHLALKGQADTLQLPEIPGLGRSVAGTALHTLSLNAKISTGAFSSHGLNSLAVDDLHFDSHEIGGDGSFSLLRKNDKNPILVDAHLHLLHANGDDLSEDHSDEQGKNSPSSENNTDKKHYDSVQALLSSLQSQHVTFDLTADQFIFSGIDYRNVHIGSKLSDGHFVLNPAVATVEGVPLSAQVDIDGTVHPALFRLKAMPWIIPSAQVFQLMGQPSVLDGLLQVNGNIQGQGDSLNSIISSLNGNMGLSMVQGRIQTAVLAPLAGPAAALLKLGNASLSLRCAAVHFNFNKGKSIFDQLTLQTKHFIVRGQGNIGLEDGALSLQLLPHVNLAGNSFAIPMQVNGTVMAPNVNQIQTSDGKNQVDFGSEDPSHDPCQGPLQKVRDGYNGLPLPAMPNDHSQASGFLKSLGIGGK